MKLDEIMQKAGRHKSRKRIGRGPIEREEDFAVDLKDFTQFITGLLSPHVVAIGSSVIRVGTLHGLPRFGAYAGVVIAGKLTSFWR